MGASRNGSDGTRTATSGVTARGAGRYSRVFVVCCSSSVTGREEAKARSSRSSSFGRRLALSNGRCSELGVTKEVADEKGVRGSGDQAAGRVPESVQTDGAEARVRSPACNGVAEPLRRVVGHTGSRERSRRVR